MTVVSAALRRPAPVAALIGGVVLVLAAPAIGLKTGPFSVGQLPHDDPARQDAERIQHAFGGGYEAPFTIVAARQGRHDHRARAPRRAEPLAAAHRRHPGRAERDRPRTGLARGRTAAQDLGRRALFQRKSRAVGERRAARPQPGPGRHAASPPCASGSRRRPPARGCSPKGPATPKRGDRDRHAASARPPPARRKRRRPRQVRQGDARSWRRRRAAPHSAASS